MSQKRIKSGSLNRVIDARIYDVKFDCYLEHSEAIFRELMRRAHGWEGADSSDLLSRVGSCQACPHLVVLRQSRAKYLIVFLQQEREAGDDSKELEHGRAVNKLLLGEVSFQDAMQ